MNDSVKSFKKEITLDQEVQRTQMKHFATRMMH